ncbi:MAG: hypothetical protein ACYC96_03000 [Fimbriimonadaceae bacterium]
MPFGWAWLPLGVLDSALRAAPQAVTQQRPPPNLEVKSGPIRIVQLPEAHYEIANAVLSYGATVVTADQIDIYPNGKGGGEAGTGFAHGHVQLSDPIGTLSADEATFNWINHTGEASNAVIQVEGVHITAARVQIGRAQWTLEEVRMGVARGRPIAYATASRAVVRPGTGITFYSFEPDLLGMRMGGVHHLDIGFNTERGLGGDRYPSPSWSGDGGFGARYLPRYLINDRTAVAGAVTVTQSALPSYSLEFARSYLAAGEAHGLVVPGSDLDPRFAFGYFDGVGIDSPTQEHEEISYRRFNVGVGAFYDVQAFDRKGNEVFAKPFEATAERAFGMPKGYALLTDNTFEQVHVLGGSDHDRYLNLTTVAFPLIRLAPTLTSRFRIDEAAYLNPSSAFGWAHAQLGLIYRPNERLRVGAAYNAAKQFGAALYQSDELYSLDSLDLRTDVQFGPHRVSLLAKYDADRRRWYDAEIAVFQTVGPLQFFARYRSFPSQVVFGGEVRLDSVINELQKRNPGRPPPLPKLAD